MTWSVWRLLFPQMGPGGPGGPPFGGPGGPGPGGYGPPQGWGGNFHQPGVWGQQPQPEPGKQPGWSAAAWGAPALPQTAPGQPPRATLAAALTHPRFLTGLTDRALSLADCC